MLNVDSIGLKTKELLTYHYGCHSNLVTIATRRNSKMRVLAKIPLFTTFMVHQCR